MKLNLIALSLVTISTMFTLNTSAEILDPNNILGALDKSFATSFESAFKNETSAIRTEVCVYDYEQDMKSCELDKVKINTRVLSRKSVEIETNSKDGVSQAIITKDVWSSLNNNPIRFFMLDSEDELTIKSLSYAERMYPNEKFNSDEESDTLIVSYENILVNHLGKNVPGVRLNLETYLEFEGSDEKIVIPFYYEFAKNQTMIKTLNKFDINFLELATVTFEIEK